MWKNEYPEEKTVNLVKNVNKKSKKKNRVLIESRLLMVGWKKRGSRTSDDHCGCTCLDKGRGQKTELHGIRRRT